MTWCGDPQVICLVRRWDPACGVLNPIGAVSVAPKYEPSVSIQSSVAVLVIVNSLATERLVETYNQMLISDVSPLVL